MINGVAGVIIWTDDLDAMLGFYRDTLGLIPNSVRPHFVSIQVGRGAAGDWGLTRR